MSFPIPTILNVATIALWVIPIFPSLSPAESIQVIRPTNNLISVNDPHEYFECSQSNSPFVFTGTITGIQHGRDGDVVKLTHRVTGEILYAVISIPNLGPESSFDFNAIELGNVLEVSGGEPFELGEKRQMAARSAKHITEPPIESPFVFTGTITGIQHGGDGDIVELTHRVTGEILYAVISIPNLGPESSFDFSAIELGNVLEVSGDEPFELGGKRQMAARSAKHIMEP